ncbi:drug/metabolite transporter, EamA family [Gottschalkia acidurici 9a]|uniref:Drug/metabolite transporter, EamA family n=1 Tax=Gottschalkia acidurici (strain ATCC 7906 / DSM 604 / BCRC 14475 / CIP 104303 / KCTC 5404 / NCIMB 10678 / 9a) TaxID=1128398 RepID=K0B3Z6_GOTA9|nr:DMT family transporter [Gottschalkia acidurici]AFS79645.1 drug/metabolite transporter, EamA family [Gottschalkia acidurici 9a]
MVKIKDRQKGILLMLLSALCFAIMASFVKSLENYPVTEKVFFRNFLSLLVSIFIIVKNKHSFKGNNKKFLLMRSITGMLGIAFYFYAISHLPLADAVIMNNMSPFFVAILSFIILKENITKSQIGALFLAIIGVTLITRPTLNVTVVPAVIGLLSAFFAGCSYVSVRYLRNTDSPDVIVFYFALITSLCMLPFALAGDWLFPMGVDLLKAIAIGIFATAAQYSLTYAYRFAEASEISIYNYTSIIFSSIIGIAIFSEKLEIYTILGGLLIIGGGFINYYSKRKV